LQPIEGYRIARLAWGTTNAQPITIGFWSCHYRPGLYSGAIRNGANNRSYVFSYTQNGVFAAQYNTVTIPGDTTGTWPTDNTAAMFLSFSGGCGSTYIAPSINTWTAGNYFAASGQVNAVQTVQDQVMVTGVVVLPGIEAPSAARSAYIMRPYDQEKFLCKRYYVSETYTNRWLHPIELTNIFRRQYNAFNPEMRIVPVVTVTGTAVGSAFGAGHPQALYITPYGCDLQGDLQGAGYSYITSLKADARL
jgi:hypothetical protein